MNFLAVQTTDRIHIIRNTILNCNPHPIVACTVKVTELNWVNCVLSQSHVLIRFILRFIHFFVFDFLFIVAIFVDILCSSLLLLFFPQPSRLLTGFDSSSLHLLASLICLKWSASSCTDYWNFNCTFAQLMLLLHCFIQMNIRIYAYIVKLQFSTSLVVKETACYSSTHNTPTHCGVHCCNCVWIGNFWKPKQCAAHRI